MAETTLSIIPYYYYATSILLPNTKNQANETMSRRRCTNKIIVARCPLYLLMQDQQPCILRSCTVIDCNPSTMTAFIQLHLPPWCGCVHLQRFCRVGQCSCQTSCLEHHAPSFQHTRNLWTIRTAHRATCHLESVVAQRFRRQPSRSPDKHTDDRWVLVDFPRLLRSPSTPPIQPTIHPRRREAFTGEIRGETNWCFDATQLLRRRNENGSKYGLPKHRWDDDSTSTNTIKCGESIVETP